jgi:hypothetical protein
MSLPIILRPCKDPKNHSIRRNKPYKIPLQNRLFLHMMPSPAFSSMSIHSLFHLVEIVHDSEVEVLVRCCCSDQRRTPPILCSVTARAVNRSRVGFLFGLELDGRERQLGFTHLDGVRTNHSGDRQGRTFDSEEKEFA